MEKAHPEALRDYFWLCTQKSFLVGWGDHMGCRKLNPVNRCKANELPAVLSLRHYRLAGVLTIGGGGGGGTMKVRRGDGRSGSLV